MSCTKVSVVGTKGGMGKSSVARNLGIIKAQEGKKVLLIDLCQNSDVATKLGYDRNAFDYYTEEWLTNEVPFEAVVNHDPETGVDFVPSSNQVDRFLDYVNKNYTLNKYWVMKNIIEKIEHNYDFIFIDNHPAESNDMMLYSLVASNLALVPVMMDLSHVKAAARTLSLIKDLQVQGVDLDYNIVPFAVDFNKGFLQELNAVKATLSAQGYDHFTHAVRYSAAIMRASLRGEVLSPNNKYIQQVMEDYKVISECVGTQQSV